MVHGEKGQLGRAGKPPSKWEVSEKGRGIRDLRRRAGIVPLTADHSETILVKGKGRNGRWGFPKGVIEKGEMAREAAVRELREETGIDIGKLISESRAFIDVRNFDYQMRLYVVVSDVFRCSPLAPETTEEIAGVRHVPLKYLPRRKGHSQKLQIPNDEKNGQASTSKFLNDDETLCAEYVSRVSEKLLSLIKSGSLDTKTK